MLFDMRMMVKRKYKTLGILGCIAVIFFFLQFFSLRKLNLWSGENRVAHSANELSEIDDGEVFEREMKQAEKDIEQEEKDKKTLFTGIHLKDMKLYLPDENGFFTCHHSKVKIPMDRVNDDFCDCSDSSDEPGTNACPHSKFYCKYQMEGEDIAMVAGSKVNDGICDCCDGSDEWANHRVPFYIEEIGESEKYGVSHAPCKNSCQKNLLNKAQQLRVRRIGLKLSEKYINAAKHLPAKANFGPKNIFYILSKDCWELKIEPYEYRICPFREVTQVEFPSGHFNLGREPQWLKMEKGNYILWMKNGDYSRCPSVARSTKIQFICGLQDHPLSIKEENKCEYSVKFTTPAAC